MLIAIIVFCCFCALLGYACCVASGKASRAEEEIQKRMEDPEYAEFNPRIE